MDYSLTTEQLLISYKKLKGEIAHKNKKFEEWGMENKKLREENQKLKDYHFTYDKSVWSPVELLRITDKWDANWGDVCKEVERIKKENEKLTKKIEEQAKEYDELKGLYSKMVAEMDMWKEKSVELGLENEKLKELKAKYEQEDRKKASAIADGCMKVVELEMENKKLKAENEKLKSENIKLSKESMVQSDLINNLFAHKIRDANIDDGISISDNYGNKYIDKWNKDYDDLIKEHIEIMNECELDESINLVFHGRDNIEFEFVESDESDEEKLPESEDVGGLDTK